MYFRKKLTFIRTRFWAKSASVETFWRHNVTWKSGYFPAFERGSFSLLYSLRFLKPHSLFPGFCVAEDSPMMATDNPNRSNFQALIAANREVAFPCSQRSLCEIQSSFVLQRDRSLDQTIQ